MRNPHKKRTPEQRLEEGRIWRAKVRLIIQKAKEKPCADCGVQYPYYVMDFDHNGDKLLLISRGYKVGHAKLVAEIAKCDVVCSNCHRERTYQRKLGKL